MSLIAERIAKRRAQAREVVEPRELRPKPVAAPKAIISPQTTSSSADQVWRDYSVDGDPTSGAHKPIKSEIRELHEEIAASIAATGAATGVSGVIDLGKTNIDTTGTDDVSIRIADAIAEMADLGGGTVRLPHGIFRIDSTIEVTVNNVTLAGVGWGQQSYTNEVTLSAEQSTRLSWGGAAGGTMIKFYTPNATPTPRRRFSGGLQFLTIDGNWSASIGLHVEAWANGYFNRVNVMCCTEDQLLTSVPNYAVTGGAGSVQKNHFDHCQCIATNTSGPGATATANGIRLTGRASIGGNTSANTFSYCTVTTRYGIPWMLENTDDNMFIYCLGAANGPPDDPGTTLLYANGITNASPAVFTYGAANNHPTNGWKVFLSGVYGMSQVNGHIYTIRNVNTGARTFELYNEADTTPIDSTAFGTFASWPITLDGVSLTTNARAMPITPGFVFGSGEQDSVDGTTCSRSNYLLTLDTSVRARAGQAGGSSSVSNVVFFTRANNNPNPQIEFGGGGSANAGLSWTCDDGDIRYSGLLSVSGIRQKNGLASLRPAIFFTGQRPPVSSTDGTDTTPDVTWLYVAELFLPMNCVSSGIQFLMGSAVGNSVKCAVYNSAGTRLRQTLGTSVAAATPNTLHQIPWGSGVKIELSGPQVYYLGIMFNGTTARFRTHTFGGFGAGVVTGQVYANDPSLTIVPPTTFTASQGPIASLY